MPKNKNKDNKLAFKIRYNNNEFSIGFAEKNLDTEKFSVLNEFNLTPKQFKFYFERMLVAVIEYNEKTGINMIEEIVTEKK